MQSAASGGAKAVFRAEPVCKARLHAESYCRVGASHQDKRQAAIVQMNGHGVQNIFQGDFSACFCLMRLEERRVEWGLTFLKHHPPGPRLGSNFFEPHPSYPMGTPTS